MKLFIASDHAGFSLKETLKKTFTNVEWVDLGPESESSVHYPDYAGKLCHKILEKNKNELLEPAGVLICGSGVGMSMAANRFKGIRAVLAFSEEVAKLSRQHNASNVLCLGARLIEAEAAKRILTSWLATQFEGGRHQDRIGMMDV